MKEGAKKTGKPARNKKVHYAVFAAILVAVIFIILFILSYGRIAAILFSPQIPASFVENQTLVTDENALFTYEINRYPANVRISSMPGENITVGFALEPGSINFGIVPAGGSAGKRFITLENIAEKQSKIMLAAYGNISQMVIFGSNNFLLSKNAPKSIEIIIQTNNETLIGNYSGEIDIIVKKPKYGFAEKLL